MFTGPAQEVGLLRQMIGLSSCKDLKNLPDITFVLDKHIEVTLTPKEYVVDFPEEGCIEAFFDLEYVESIEWNITFSRAKLTMV